MHEGSDDRSVSAASAPGAARGPLVALQRAVRDAIASSGGWIPFSRYMAIALYEPGLGYYASGRRTFGRLPSSGSDFVTAPEFSPLFARALARPVAQSLDACGLDEIVEFGAGSGALARDLVAALGDRLRRYSIVEVSAAMRERQRAALAELGDRVRWLDAWPEAIAAVVVGNEVLDAMPVDLVHFDGSTWLDRGVTLGDDGVTLAWADRPGTNRPPVDADFVPGTTTELHPQAIAFVRTLAERLDRGAAFFVDYGFPADEYYHPQRTGGTLMCHRAHRADTDPLEGTGAKDITSHLDFTALALAGQDAGLDVVGYTSQARFLLDCGIAAMIDAAPLRERIDALRLVHEHEMGELFKVLAFAKGCAFEPIGFRSGDRRHRL